MDAVCADAVIAAEPVARHANNAHKIFFALRFILKFTGVADAELKLAAIAVIGIVVNGNAIVEP